MTDMDMRRQMLVKVDELMGWSFRAGKRRVSDEYFAKGKKESLDSLEIWFRRVLL